MMKTRDLGAPSPTCWSQYPPSSAMCLSVETRHSENGPFARVSARLEKNVTTTPRSRLSYHLESRVGPKGVVAIAAHSPVYLDTSSAVNETGLLGGPVSRVAYHPTTKIESLQRVSTHIECTTTTEGSFTKVTQSASDKEAVNHPAISSTCSQNDVKYNTSIASTATKDLSAKNGTSFENCSKYENEIFETNLADGKIAKGVIKPNGLSLYLESGRKISSARVDQRLAGNKLDQIVDTLGESNIQVPTGSKLHNSKELPKVAALSRRNGLDPNRAEMQGQEGKWKYLKPKVQQDLSHGIKKPEKSVSRKKVSDDGKQVAKKKLEKQVNRNFQGIPLPSPEELISDYREYLSEKQLKNYQYCSTRRNGLQDECYLSVPRAVLQIKSEEMRNWKN